MQLRYKEKIMLKKSENQKQSNGAYISNYIDLQFYNVQIQELTDEVSASIYGATINKMYRISSPKQMLEKFLKSKLNNSNDNLSQYLILYNELLYKIITVRQEYIDVEYKEGI